MAEHSTVDIGGGPNEPARQVIATFDNYADAERASSTCPTSDSRSIG